MTVRASGRVDNFLAIPLSFCGIASMIGARYYSSANDYIILVKNSGMTVRASGQVDNFLAIPLSFCGIASMIGARYYSSADNYIILIQDS